MIPRIIDGQPMRRMPAYRVMFEHCGRSFIYPTIYKSSQAKRIAMSGSMLQSLSHFRNASTDAFHLPRLPSWVHFYICCIVSGATSQRKQILVFACPCCCRIVMVGKVLLMNFVMKRAMWTIAAPCPCLNDVSLIPSQSTPISPRLLHIKYPKSGYFNTVIIGN